MKMIHLATTATVDTKASSRAAEEETHQDGRIIDKCGECGGKDIILDPNRGDKICQKCGMVLSERELDTGPEWRSYDSLEDSQRSRVGDPASFVLHDKGLSTSIGSENRDFFGTKLTASQRAQVYRLRSWQVRTRTNTAMERNLAFAMTELDRISSQLGIPRSIRETSAIIYRKAIQHRLTRGRSIEGMVAATLYSSTRIRRIPRTLDEVAAESRVTKKDLGKYYRVLIRELEIKIPLASPLDYLPRLGTSLRLSGTAQRKAASILRDAKEKGLTVGKDPTGMAAAAIYISGLILGEKRTQREIAAVAHVTEVTVRNRYKELEKKLHIKI